MLTSDDLYLAHKYKAKHDRYHSGPFEDCTDWHCDAALNILTDPRA